MTKHKKSTDDMKGADPIGDEGAGTTAPGGPAEPDPSAADRGNVVAPEAGGSPQGALPGSTEPAPETLQVDMRSGGQGTPPGSFPTNDAPPIGPVYMAKSNLHTTTRNGQGVEIREGQRFASSYLADETIRFHVNAGNLVAVNEDAKAQSSTEQADTKKTSKK